MLGPMRRTFGVGAPDGVALGDQSLENARNRTAAVGAIPVTPAPPGNAS